MIGGAARRGFGGFVDLGAHGGGFGRGLWGSEISWGGMEGSSRGDGKGAVSGVDEEIPLR
jgi:hypothetical protein